MRYKAGMNDFSKWYYSTSPAIRKLVAQAAGTNTEYLRHIVRRRRQPRPKLVRRIAEATGIPYADLLAWVYAQ